MIESWFITCNRCDYWLIQTLGEFCGRDCPTCLGGRLSTSKPTDITGVIVIMEEALYTVPFDKPERVPNINIRNQQLLEAQYEWQKQEDAEIFKEIFEAVEEQNAGSAVRIEDEN